MTHHFGVLIPSTNTTVEIEYSRLLPPTLQAHVGRLLTSGTGPFAPSKDEDVDYQARLLGTAKVEVISLAQTSASLFADDYDADHDEAHERSGGCGGDHLGAGDRPGGAGAGRAADRAGVALFSAGDRAGKRDYRASTVWRWWRWKASQRPIPT